MNGHELAKTTLVECSTTNELDRGASDEEERERWAALVAGSVGVLPPAAPILPPLATDAALGAPEGWRQSVGDLTPTGAGGEVIGGAPGTAASRDIPEQGLPQRVQVRVKTEEFGEVSVIIERAEQGLRILMGAVDGRVVSALRHEALAVRRAIENGGQTVGSFEIVRMDQLGTNLAQPRLAPGNRVRRLREQADAASGPEDRKNKKARRLNLIG